MALANTIYPIISIRLKSTALQGIALLRSLQVATNDITNIFWRLVEIPTLTGTVWTDPTNSNAFTQYDISATAYT